MKLTIETKGHDVSYTPMTDRTEITRHTVENSALPNIWRDELRHAKCGECEEPFEISEGNIEQLVSEMAHKPWPLHFSCPKCKHPHMLYLKIQVGTCMC